MTLIAKKLLQKDLQVGRRSEITAAFVTVPLFLSTSEVGWNCGFVTISESEKYATEEANYLRKPSRHLQKSTYVELSALIIT